MQLVDVVVATGGAAMVKSAYSSGTPSFGVGAGNAVGIVDETADPSDAARKIAASKIFDNATSCSSENSVVSRNHLDACGVARSGGGLPVQHTGKGEAPALHVAGRNTPQPARPRAAGRADAAGVVVPEATGS